LAFAINALVIRGVEDQLGGARPRASLGPTARDLVFLADARLVGEPDLYGAGIDAGLAPDLLQARRETS